MTNELGGASTGVVDFYTDGALRESRTLDATSTATWNGDVAAGAHTFTANYRGDGQLDPAFSSPVAFTVS